MQFFTCLYIHIFILNEMLPRVLFCYISKEYYTYCNLDAHKIIVCHLSYSRSYLFIIQIFQLNYKNKHYALYQKIQMSKACVTTQHSNVQTGGLNKACLRHGGRIKAVCVHIRQNSPGYLEPLIPEHRNK